MRTSETIHRTSGHLSIGVIGSGMEKMMREKTMLTASLGQALPRPT